jgi:hypothetical protein
VGDGVEGVEGHEGDVEAGAGLEQGAVGVAEAVGDALQVALPAVGLVEGGVVVARGGGVGALGGVLRAVPEPPLQPLQPVLPAALAAVEDVVGDEPH